jgi:hypothetical protein
MAISSGHRWPMRSMFQKSNGIFWCLLLVLTSTVCLKIQSKPSKVVFLIIHLAKWALRSTKYEFVKRISKTNEAAGLIAFYPNWALKTCLVSLRVAYSDSKLHELVAQSFYPCRWSCLDRIRPVAIHMKSKFFLFMVSIEVRSMTENAC